MNYQLTGKPTMYLENRSDKYDNLALMTSSHPELSRDISQLDKDIIKIVLPVLENLVLCNIPQEGHILDLCCGEGRLVRQLIRKGYRVTGFDGSKTMLNQARENAPGGEFILDDVRSFKLQPTFHAAVSLRSLVHMTSLEELTSVFQNVFAALLENGWFAFDLDLEERYQTDWEDSEGNFTDDSAWIYLRSYDSEEKVARTQYVIFQLINGAWQRSEQTLLEKPYSTKEVKAALEKVGFTEVSIYNAKHDFEADTAVGRICYVCRKPIDI